MYFLFQANCYIYKLYTCSVYMFFPDSAAAEHANALVFIPVDKGVVCLRN